MVSQPLVFRRCYRCFGEFIRDFRSFGAYLVFRVKQDFAPQTRQEVGPHRAELLLRHLPWQLRDRRRRPRRIYILRRVTRGPLLRSPSNEVPGVPAPPASLSPLASGLLALPPAADLLPAPHPRVRIEPVMADHAPTPSRRDHPATLPDFLPACRTSPCRVAYFCRADPGRFSRAPKTGRRGTEVPTPSHKLLRRKVGTRMPLITAAPPPHPDLTTTASKHGYCSQGGVMGRWSRPVPVPVRSGGDNMDSVGASEQWRVRWRAAR